MSMDPLKRETFEQFSSELQNQRRMMGIRPKASVEPCGGCGETGWVKDMPAQKYCGGCSKLRKELRKKEEREKKGSLQQYEMNGVNRPLIEWAREYRISPGVVRGRLNMGWDLRRALTTRVRKKMR